MNVTYADLMVLFKSCKLLRDVNIPCFRKEPNDSLSALFSYSKKLERLQVSSGVGVTYADLAILFENCSKLNYLDLGDFDSRSEDLVTLSDFLLGRTKRDLHIKLFLCGLFFDGFIKQNNTTALARVRQAGLNVMINHVVRPYQLIGLIKQIKDSQNLALLLSDRIKKAVLPKFSVSDFVRLVKLNAPFAKAVWRYTKFTDKEALLVYRQLSKSTSAVKNPLVCNELWARLHIFFKTSIACSGRVSEIDALYRESPSKGNIKTTPLWFDLYYNFHQQVFYYGVVINELLNYSSVQEVFKTGMKATSEPYVMIAVFMDRLKNSWFSPPGFVNFFHHKSVSSLCFQGLHAWSALERFGSDSVLLAVELEQRPRQTLLIVLSDSFVLMSKARLNASTCIAGVDALISLVVDDLKRRECHSEFGAKEVLSELNKVVSISHIRDAFFDVYPVSANKLLGADTKLLMNAK